MAQQAASQAAAVGAAPEPHRRRPVHDTHPPVHSAAVARHSDVR